MRRFKPGDVLRSERTGRFFLVVKDGRDGLQVLSGKRAGKLVNRAHNQWQLIGRNYKARK